MKELLNAMQQHAQMATQSRAATRHGLVTSYNPNTYSVKVTLQPDGTQTGWIALKSIWVGNQWGLFCPPSIGDCIELDFQEDDASVATGGWRFYNDSDRSLPCPSGEFWLVHKSGSSLKFKNDGSVEVISNQNLNATVGGNLAATVTGTANITATGAMTIGGSSVTINGNTQINGTLNTSGNITAPDATIAGKLFTTHKHTGVTAGGAQTGNPA